MVHGTSSADMSREVGDVFILMHISRPMMEVIHGGYGFSRRQKCVGFAVIPPAGP